ncbi:MAG TPA: nitrate reductase molybdenum cofactor assembly chaperone [Mycobacterium sp.]|nr:nitrate reductase molybdenum cofactor assembly chaperone [Mycobacterium sp.]
MNTQTAKLASVLLQYPTVELFDGLDELDRFAATVGPKSARESFQRFLDWLRATPSTEVARHYVQTFDLRRRCALYLTYYRYGDTRKRGMAMVVFKAAYRDAGFVVAEDDLPDFLPIVLDFAALCPKGERLLANHRTDLELLRRALIKAESPYAEIVAAVATALPKLGKQELGKVRAAWKAGPPAEEVGLEPFAPPDYLSGYGTGNGGVQCH